MNDRPGFKQIPSVKTMINLGALLDIPTGYYVKGRHGENLLAGGLGAITGVVGIGNSFKSTIMHYMTASALSKVLPAHQTHVTTFDTEINKHESHLKDLLARFPELKKTEPTGDIFNDGIWSISDKSQYYANEWYRILKDYLKTKKDNTRDWMIESPFLDRDNKTLLKVVTPTFSEIDSLSEFETEDVAKLQDDNDLGESGGNIVFMRQGLSKARFLMDIPTIAGNSGHFFLMTGHVGKEMEIAKGPYAPPPAKKLQGLKNGDKLKGVTDRFFFLLNNCWQTFHTAPLINQGTKAPEYPKFSSDQVSGDVDLFAVSMRQLRGKAGTSGFHLEIIVSQTEGVLPSLTEFNYIKNEDRFGLEGNNVNYYLSLYPDVKLTRPTVRSKIDDDQKLRTAILYTSEMCQIFKLWKNFPKELICTPKELYEDLKAKGYDWNILLNSRPYWVFNNENQERPFLSTLDLLEMRVGRYHPYWLEKK